MSKKVPQIRFNGFTDPWEERKLGDFIKISREQEVKKVDLHEEKIGYYVLAMRTFDFEGYIDYSKPYWINNFESADDDLFLNRKEFAIIDADMDASLPKIGKVLLNATNNKFLLAAHIRKIKVDVQVDSIFAYALMRTTELVERLKLEANGSISKRLLDKNVYKQKVYLPIHLEEQQQIGEFFWTLEETIALHQRKLDLLKEQKKGYLQKMFPKNGAKVPELRFAGFADDWEERKLKDVVEKQIKGKAQFEKLAPGDVEYLDTSRLNGGQAILTNGFKDVTLDDVLILWDGSKAGTVYHGFEGSLGSTLKAYRTSADSKFVYQYLKRHQDNIYNNYRTPNIPHVQKDFLDVFTISVPRSDEQAKIGSFFNQIDNTIALHQRKLDLLKEQKKGFLEKMFV
ncbi:restriction endonuclease subunit S [Latilactobacillus sakei]|uniref:restriction endonuclease subunit S n=1 Tax=Latilactobacillus sakei TaxID=1599 RepID=UPI003CE8258F